MKKYIKVFALLMSFSVALPLHTAYATGMTVESLKKINIEPMKDAEIKQLIVGNILVVRNTETLAHFAARFDPDGKRVMQQVSPQRDGPSIIYKTLGDAKDANVAKYEIKNNRLITHFDAQTFEVLIFKVKDKYYGARSTDAGEIKWELVLLTK